MTNTRVFTPQTTTPEPAVQVSLPIGEHSIKYDKGRKVIQVSLPPQRTQRAAAAARD